MAKPKGGSTGAVMHNLRMRVTDRDHDTAAHKVYSDIGDMASDGRGKGSPYAEHVLGDHNERSGRNRNLGRQF